MQLVGLADGDPGGVLGAQSAGVGGRSVVELGRPVARPAPAARGLLDGNSGSDGRVLSSDRAGP